MVCFDFLPLSCPSLSSLDGQFVCCVLGLRLIVAEVDDTKDREGTGEWEEVRDLGTLSRSGGVVGTGGESEGGARGGGRGGKEASRLDRERERGVKGVS